MFTFWKTQRALVQAHASPPLDVEETVDPVELYTAEGRVIAQIATQGERMSDILNRGGSIRLYRPSFSPYLEGGLREDVPWWIAMDVERVDLAIPPVHVSPPHLRRHMRQRRVEVHVGPFIVTGNAHVPPTAFEVAAYVHRLRLHFLPLTSVAISHRQEPRFDRDADVVLINADAIQAIRDLVLA
jgi:hypothetical protein